MPLPTPQRDENKDDFLPRCMADDTMQREYEDESQRRAVCESRWEKRNGENSAMKHQIYAMEPNFLSQLLSDRREILDVARTLQTADAMREMRAEVMGSLSAINIEPRNDEELAASYGVDENGVAHIPIVGELTSQAETDVCGAYTAEALTEYGFIQAATKAADADTTVNAIAYEVSSPGGYVDGVEDTANVIRSASKPTVARVGSMAASAAYWLASQADKIVATSRASRVGSIGVAVEEYDMTQALENAGITRRVYTSTDAPDKRPDTRTEEGQAKVVSMLDDLHSVFVQSVAEGRGVSVKTVNENYGKGAVLIAEKAARAGMIDGVETVPPREREETGGVAAEENSRQEEAGNSREVPMDRNQLKTEHPDLYAELEREFIEAGVKQERERVSALQGQKQYDPDNAKLAQTVDQFIADGTTLSEAQTAISVAIRDGKLDGENPPNVQPDPETTEGLEQDDLEAMRLMGISPSEYRALVKKEAN